MATNAEAKTALGVLWLGSYDADEWSIEGIDVDGRRAGFLKGLAREPRRSPDGALIATVDAGPLTRLRLFDAADGSLVNTGSAPSPFGDVADQDVDVQLAFTPDGAQVIALLTSVEQHLEGVVEKVDPDGGPTGEVAVGAWEVRRALQVFPIASGPVTTTTVPCPAGSLAAAELDVVADTVIVRGVVARPVRSNGTKAADAGFDTLRWTWERHSLGEESPTLTTTPDTPHAVPGNARPVRGASRGQCRSTSVCSLLFDGLDGSAVQELAVGSRSLRADPHPPTILDAGGGQVVVVDPRQGHLAMIDTARRRVTSEASVPIGAWCAAGALRGQGAAIDEGAARVYLADPSGLEGGIYVFALPALDLVSQWHPSASFDLLAVGAGGRLFAKATGSRALVVFEPHGEVVAIANLTADAVGALA